VVDSDSEYSSEDLRSLSLKTGLGPGDGDSFLDAVAVVLGLCLCR
jgi:hypothetical protein